MFLLVVFMVVLMFFILEVIVEICNIDVLVYWVMSLVRVVLLVLGGFYKIIEW